MKNIKTIISLIFAFLLLFVNINITNAAGAGTVFKTTNITEERALSNDIAIRAQQLEDLKKKTDTGFLNNVKQLFSTFSWEKAKALLEESGSAAFNAATKAALKKIAYDAATYVGSGGQGQQPMFIKEGWGTYLSNIGDEAAGTYIETFSSAAGWKFNVCEPTANVKMKISFGLKEQVRPSKPNCTFTKMVNNWDAAVKSPTFLNDFQNMFDPGSNDLGIALTMQSNFLEDQQKKKDEQTLARTSNGEWLRAKEGIGNKYAQGSIDIPGGAARIIDSATQAITGDFGKWSGNAFNDAINVFVNQLLLTLYNRMLSQMGKDVSNYTDSYSGDYGLSNYDSSGSIAMGEKGIKEKVMALVKPNFSERTDYDILADLTMCPDPTKPNTRNCVITERFRQAIADKKMVGEALNDGTLNAGGKFGFSNENLEPNYQDENYPYRSMMILRKYRIIPVGWEIAAQYINQHINDISGHNTLKDMVDCFDPNDDFHGYGEAGSGVTWCHGLVDPYWVLKAPKNYCKREGFGPQILQEQVSGEGRDSTRNITRESNYCADEQSCIKENGDGSCQTFGYCTEEKRTWGFGTDACEPVYNTCQSFEGRDGRSVSYLENTLDYSGCNIDNAGCREYRAASTSNPLWVNTFYNSASNTVNWASSTDPKYFDKDVEACDAENEGCHGIIRTKPGFGTNLIKDGGFEDNLVTYYSGMDKANMSQDGAYEGTRSYKIAASGGSASADINIGTPITGETFTLSFYASSTCGGDFGLGFASSTTMDATSTIVSSPDYWAYNRITYSFGNTASYYVYLNINNSTSTDCYIDNIKLERGQATRYSEYGSNNLVFEKIMPSYLELACDGTANEPAICAKFARKCSADAVGCEMYTSDTDGTKIPGKAGAYDYCGAECVGYNRFIQLETPFDSARTKDMIPSKVKACTANLVGCDEFTNLDKLGQGAEAKEYYSELRQCQVSSEPSCTEYYSWEGSDESGFQVKVYSLKASSTAAGEPDTTTDDSALCNANIYTNYGADNPDCREFTDKNGVKSYHLYTKTISCSDNCHPYRRTEKNMVEDNSTVGPHDCAINPSSGGDERCRVDANNMIICKDGARWNFQQQACVYMAIPDEGQKCAAAQVGCREYTGSKGNNMRTISASNFEGSLQNWAGIGATNITMSNESLMNGGHSLALTAGTYIGTNVSSLTKNKSYVLSMLVKAGTAANITITASIGSSTAMVDRFDFDNTATVTPGQWHQVKMNMASLDRDLGPSEKLIINVNNQPVYFDDIKLTEISDRYYLLKDSDATPASCRDNDWRGCDRYTDRDNLTHNIFQFTRLCSEPEVGCELVIDTKNSLNSIASDSPAYITYDPDKQCAIADKGCERFGQVSTYNNSNLYSDTYLKNDPDKEAAITCAAEDVYCDSWTATKGAAKENVFFRDPGNSVCEYRLLKNGGDKSAWLKKKVNRCDANSNGSISKNIETKICGTDADCGGAIKCILDDNDYNCDLQSDHTTFGFGGMPIPVPGSTTDTLARGTWAGACPASQSSCTEVIDPISQFNNNLVYNPDCVDLNGDGTLCDYWGFAGGAYYKDISLEKNTLYVLSVTGNSSGDVIEFRNGRSISGFTSGSALYLDNDNNLISSSSVSLTGGSARIYTEDNQPAVRIIRGNNTSATISIKKAIIDYRLGDNFDYTSCNGVANTLGGCVVFNKRSVTGNKVSFVDKTPLYSNLNLDADSENKVSCTGADCEGDKIIKVTSNRVCDKWLSCQSTASLDSSNVTSEKACLDIGLCSSMSDSGTCNNFVSQANQNEYELDNLLPGSDYLAKNMSNFSGYVKVGLDNLSTKNKPDRNLFGNLPFGEMSQETYNGNITNGNFEYAGANLYPTGWQFNSVNTTWDQTFFKVINNPIEAQYEGVGYAPEGRGFLKTGTAYPISSDFIDITAGTKYNLSAYLNTINLTSGAAYVVAELYDNNLVIRQKNFVKLDSGLGWQMKSYILTSRSDTTRLKIRITSADPSSATSTPGIGNFYIDDISLKPSLQVRSDGAGSNLAYSYVGQTCRLYPKDDSLSCDYYEDSGMRYKGWPGYCLQYDRSPGDDNSCLMWWPVDRVQGDGSLEGYTGYQGNYPLYYCSDLGANFKFVEQRSEHLVKTSKSYSWSLGGYLFVPFSLLWNPGGNTSAVIIDGCPTGPAGGYHIRTTTKKSSSGWFKTKTTTYTYCTPNSDRVSGNWYDYNFSLISYGPIDEVTPGVKIYDVKTGSIVDQDKYKLGCDRLHQVINSIGENKVWSERVYPGTNYVVGSTTVAATGANPYPGQLMYPFETDLAPFGRALVPEPAGNPQDWNIGGPLSILPQSSQEPRAGSPYSCIGNQCSNLGRCSISKDICLFVPKNDPSVPGTGYITQTFLACPTGQTCSTTLLKMPTTANYAPQHLKRIYAKSYGDYQWNGQQGYCSNDQTMSCDTSSDNECPSGICEAQCSVYYQTAGTSTKYYDTDAATGAIIPYGSCTAGSPGQCDLNSLTISGNSVTSMNASNSCNPFPGSCPGGTVNGCITQNCCLPVGAHPTASTTCSGVDANNDDLDDGALSNACCLGATAADAMVEYNTCSSTYNKLIASTSPLVGGNANVGICTLTKDGCDITGGSGECQMTATCEYGLCRGGDKDLAGCSKPQQCGINSCASSQANGRYGLTGGSVWDVPTNPCAGGVRPPLYSALDADYCFIPPRLFNIKVNDTSSGGPVSVHPSNKQAKLEFNSDVDGNQMPLISYTVDWGDGSPQSIMSQSQMQDRPDPTNPHVLYHEYDYNNTSQMIIGPNAANPNAWGCQLKSNTAPCCDVNGDYCYVRPKVILQDNWGKCSSASGNCGTNDFTSSPVLIKVEAQ